MVAHKIVDVLGLRREGVRDCLFTQTGPAAITKHISGADGNLPSAPFSGTSGLPSRQETRPSFRHTIEYAEKGGAMMPERMLRYNRRAAVAYAHRWAFRRNPVFYDYEGLGGDCTNFASQCLYAGNWSDELHARLRLVLSQCQ